MKNFPTSYILVFEGVLFLFSCQASGRKESAEVKQPNVLFVFADDQRAHTEKMILS